MVAQETLKVELDSGPEHEKEKARIPKDLERAFTGLASNREIKRPRAERNACHYVEHEGGEPEPRGEERSDGCETRKHEEEE